jgi:cytochrome c oxidase subunit 3
MEIPYTVNPRPDTGLANPKLGIWLFLASEVMLFGGLFAGYIFMRLGAEPWMWPHGWLNVPVGTFNTFILIASSVTVILSWEALKMRNFKAFKWWLFATWMCGILFLVVKLSIEWPAKFSHFGAYIKKEAAEKYEAQLGNEDIKDDSGKVIEPGYVSRKGYPRLFIGGHPKSWDDVKNPAVKEIVLEGVDEENHTPRSADNDRAHFMPRPIAHLHEGHEVVLQKSDLIANYGPLYPKLNTYLACYFMITGLHGLHVLGGVLVFIYFWGPGAKLFKTNPEQLSNRIEVAGLFWHLVDLIWIFVFPIFYLL